MKTVLFEFFGMVITPWKLVGYLGVALFAGRWFIQLFASRRHGKPMLPRTFWYMSATGSVLLLAYFIFWQERLGGGPLQSLPALRCALQPAARHPFEP